MANKPDTGGGSSPPAPSTPAADSKASTHDLKPRKGQFIVAPRRHPGMQMMGIAPLSMSVV